LSKQQILLSSDVQHRDSTFITCNMHGQQSKHIAGTLIPMPGNIVDTPILSIDRLLLSLLYVQYETSGL